ncbi:MAG: hypothetical protein ABWJ42_04360 [Sulfolobales archaeon]
MVGRVFMRVVVVPFASSIHERYYVRALEIFRSYFSKYEIEIGSVIAERDLAKIYAKSYVDSLPIALVLTGGVSRVIRDFVLSGGFRHVLILAHSEHNSLASAVSARARLERSGVAVSLYHCENPDSRDCEDIVDRVYRVASVVSGLNRLRIGIVSDRDKEESDVRFEKRFDSEIIFISLEDLASEMSRVDDAKLREFYEYIRERLSFEMSLEHVYTVGRLYHALKSIVLEKRLDAVSIDCFPFITRHKITPCIPLAILNSEGVVAGCEADIQALFGMILARRVSGKSGWIANIVSAKSSRVMFAHCTVSLDIARSPRALAHFETLNPYAVSGEIVGDIVTMISVDDLFDKIYVERGRIIRSGMLVDTACRTQALVEVDFNAEDMPRVAPANHHVIIPGDYTKILSDVARLLGFEVIRYRDLARY